MGASSSSPDVPDRGAGLEILTNALDAAICMNRDGEITLWNAQAESMFGWTANEVLDKPLADVIIPERFRDAHWTGLHRALDAGSGRGAGRRIEIEALHRDGHEFPVELTVTANSEDPPMFAAFLRDVSERRALEADSARLAAIIESSPQSMILMDLRWVVIGWSPGAEAVTGYSEAEAIGRDVSFLTPPGLEPVNRELALVVAGGEPAVGRDTKSLCKDGTIIDISLSVYPVRDANGRVIAIASTSLDITNRKRLEAEALSSHERFRKLFDLFPIPAALTGLHDDVVLEANQAFLDLASLTPWAAAGRSLFGWLVAQGQGEDLVKELVEVGSVNEREVVSVNRSGEELVHLVSGVAIEIDGQPAGLWMGVDVTRQRQLEEQVLQSANLEVTGRLAAGLAHDFNNLLSVMLAQADFLLKQVAPGSPTHESVSEIRDASVAAAGLTSQLLAIGGRQPLSPATIQLNQVVAKMRGLLVATLGPDVQYSADLPTDLWSIEADPVQLERVFMNLAVDAKEAMPEGGEFVISGANVDITDATLGGVAPGQYVEIRVKDNGTGMDLETQAHLFEPFYTTKASGMGLGLATVRGIVTQSGGAVSVSSELGEGTEFRLLFPRLEPGQD